MIRRRTLLASLAALIPAAALAETPPRIVAFGDSLTEGFGLPPQQGLVPQLQNWLDAQKTPARMINQGLSGDTTYGGRIRVHWALRRGADGVIVALGANDMLMGFAPEQAETNLDEILRIATQRDRPVLLAGIALPLKDLDLATRWSAIWPRLAQRHGALLLPDLAAPLTAIPQEQRAPYLLADGMHPSAKGVEMLVPHIGPPVQDLIRRALQG